MLTAYSACALRRPPTSSKPVKALRIGVKCIMSINYAEDTEFNAALRAHGIIPDLRPKKDSTPSPEVQPEREPELDELSDLEDELPSSVLEAYRSKRMAEARVADQRRQHGEIKHISRPDYTREVTEASKVDLPGEPEGSGTGVICYLFKDYLPDCKTLGPMLVRLAQWYPSSKFVSIVSDHCIPNYPDRNVPTLLCYRKGEMTGQVIGLDGFKGDIHSLLFHDCL